MIHQYCPHVIKLEPYRDAIAHVVVEILIMGVCRYM